MVFSSHIFIYYFLPFALLVYYALFRARQRWRNAWLIELAVTPSDCILSGSSTTRISRSTPPARLTEAMPGIESSLRPIVSSMNQLSYSIVISSAWTAK